MVAAMPRDYWDTPPNEAQNENERVKLLIAQAGPTEVIKLTDEQIELFIKHPHHDSFELHAITQWIEWSYDEEQGADWREVTFVRTHDGSKWVTRAFFQDAQWQYGDLVPMITDD